MTILRIRFFVAVMILIGASALSGCATIVDSGPDMVPVNSSPSGAQIFVNSSMVGTTPATIPLDRQLPGAITLKMKGYEPVTVQKFKVLNGWVFGNLCFGGVPGFIVDAITGNLQKFGDTPMMIVLTPVEPEREEQDEVARPVALNLESARQ